jgi:hypothetical protein
MDFRGDLDRKIVGLRGLFSLSAFFITNFIFYFWRHLIFGFFLFRRARERTKEDVPEMGKLAPGSSKWPYWRSLCGHARWQNAHQAVGGALRRAIGEFSNIKINLFVF